VIDSEAIHDVCLKKLYIYVFHGYSLITDRCGMTVDHKVLSPLGNSDQIWTLPLEPSGENLAASAFQLCTKLSKHHKSDTWSIKVSQFRGTDRTPPTLHIVFQNHGSFSLPDFVGGSEITLPSANPVACVFKSRERDINAESPAIAYDGMQHRSPAFRKMLGQFGDQQDKDFLRMIVKAMCQEVWELFISVCREWERSPDAIACRKAMKHQREVRRRAKSSLEAF
jgi:hypothetical protein